jgi:hypothetical protein
MQVRHQNVKSHLLVDTSDIHEVNRTVSPTVQYDGDTLTVIMSDVVGMMAFASGHMDEGIPQGVAGF